jgi:hypothetical protein
MAYTTIDDPSAYFQAAIYSGSNSALAVTNDGNSDLKPDWLWIKQRSSTENHMVVDSTRGVTKYLSTDSTAVEATVTSRVATLDTDGFTLNGASNPVNALGATYVGWQWKANGGTTSTLSNTGPDSVVQVNSDAKFSIGTYTGNGSNSNVKHGLGETPDMLIVKRRDVSTGAWAVWHKDITSTYWLRLDTTDAQASGVWDGVDPTSEKFFITGGSSNVNVSGSAYVFYAWKSVQGYSKFGKYVGNGSSDGPFVYTGFKPAFLMMKEYSSAGGNWVMFDNKRDPSNVTKTRLFPNLTNADNTTRDYIDLLSNGFKLRDTDADHNQSGESMIYMAFAENPFVTSTGIPATAR